MKTIFASLLALILVSNLCKAQDTLYTYKSGTMVFKLAVADVDSIIFSKPVTKPQGDTITDLDGNVYKIVTIGNQIWMAENLKTTKYSDNSDIPLVEDAGAWTALSTPGYSWYNNDATANKATYGALYNWYTVNTVKLCPTGWHVPTDAEWTVLTDFLGGEADAGGKLKEVGFAHWYDPNVSATNETGFSALPGGKHYSDGDFDNVGYYGSWWSSTEDKTSYAWSRSMYFSGSNVGRSSYDKHCGFSVRCLWDN